MKAKANTFITAMAAILLTACSADMETASVPDKQATAVPIAFDSYVGWDAETRGSVTGASTVQSSGFGVYAYYTAASSYSSGYSPNLMDNFQVTGSGVGETDESWSYTDTRYWPTTSTDRVSFLAYAPYVSSSTNDNGIDPTLYSIATDGTASSTSGDRTYIKYTVPTIAANTVDLLYNSNDALNQYYYGTTMSPDLNSTTGRVMMNFSHATARIGFTIKSSAIGSDITSITINKVEFGSKTAYPNNVSTEAEEDPAKRHTPITTRATATAEGLYGTFYSIGYLNLNNTTTTASWSGYGSETDADRLRTFSFDNFTSATLSNSSSTVSNSSSDYLFVIPQEFSGTSSPGVSVTGHGRKGSDTQPGVNYNREANKYYLDCYISYSVTQSGTTTDKTKTVSVGSLTLEAGKAYTINIDIKDP